MSNPRDEMGPPDEWHTEPGRTTERRIIRIFCRGRRTTAELDGDGDYRCSSCGNRIRAVNVWRDTQSNVRTLKKAARS